tara:strand:+ start:984 stop:2129 length:1146 start_codon:yes stop_codon:yes gene_type:complete
MIEIADVFRRFAGDYLDSHGDAMLPSHQRAIIDILRCQTAELGGHVYRCGECGHEIFSYHSCRNRNCPKCHTGQTRRWLEARRAEMLPVDHFHVTVTVPEELRDIFRANQKACYSILMKAAAEAVIELARDPKFVGGTVGVLAVLHTWTQQLFFHPHVHCLVTGGGASEDGATWRPARKDFLVPTRALARLLRGKVMEALAKRCPHIHLPEAVWTKDWVVHCTPWGKGERAVLDYLARYAFRIAIANCRIVEMDETTVTFRYKKRKARRWRTCRITGEEFMRRFLQHVLPKGFHKIRYYGLWHPCKRESARRVRLLFQLENTGPSEDPQSGPEAQDQDEEPTGVREGALCPHCGKGHLVHIRTIANHLAWAKIERSRALEP